METILESKNFIGIKSDYKLDLKFRSKQKKTILLNLSKITNDSKSR